MYLDNIRIFLVYNVVFYHAMVTFAYPQFFFWAVIDKTGSSRIYETAFWTMSAYMMPCLLFIAALFIYPSLKKVTSLEYIKNRFFRLYVPVIVFLFCAGDIFFQLLFNRLFPVSPVYLETFLNSWRSFANMPAVFVRWFERTSNPVTFDFQITWFLTLLFFLTLLVVLLSLPFKRRKSEPKSLDNRRKIILKTLIFAAALGIVHTAAMIYYAIHGINTGSWIILGKVVEFQNNLIWVLLAMFLFGLYVYKKDWLTRGNIGSWKIWGAIAFTFLLLYSLLIHIGFQPVVDEIAKAMEHNMRFDNQMSMPVINRSFQLTALSTYLLLPPTCVCLLMFFLSFAKRFFNRLNAITTFCSKHSINVYILHIIPVFILQYTFLNVPIPSIVKIVLMVIIIIPACLWLSHRLVYPYPKIAIAFFVALKLAALAAGFSFYCFALLALIFISFTGAVYESAKYLAARKASPEPAT